MALKIVVDEERLVAIIKQLGAGNAPNCDREIAVKIGELGSAYIHLADKFNTRAPLANGETTTLRQQLLNPPQGQKKVAAAEILRGLTLPVTSLLPVTPCKSKGKTMRFLDGQSYIAQLNDARLGMKEFSDLVSLVIYMAPVNTMKIVWIGRNQEAAQMTTHFARKSGAISWCSQLYEEYGRKLVMACEHSTPC